MPSPDWKAVAEILAADMRTAARRLEQRPYSTAADAKHAGGVALYLRARAAFHLRVQEAKK